jgi:hypothetical protein
LSLQTLSSGERRRRAPFLTVLWTHCISRSRSFPFPRIACQPAPPPPPRLPAPRHTHTQPCPSRRQRQQVPHVHAARCVGVPAFALWPASHAGRGDMLEGLCCLTCRRRLARYRLRDREAVPQRQACPSSRPRHVLLLVSLCLVRGRPCRDARSCRSSRPGHALHRRRRRPSPHPSFWTEIDQTLGDARRWTTASVRSEAEPRTPAQLCAVAHPDRLRPQGAISRFRLPPFPSIPTPVPLRCYLRSAFPCLYMRKGQAHVSG